jgi:rhamnogalacturonyl hydrolase YesR
MVMKVHFKVIALSFLFLIFQNTSAKTEFDADSIVNIMKRVAKYRMTYADIRNLFNHPEANKGDKENQWAADNQGCDWDVGSFMTGLMALYTTTKDTAYLNFAKRWATAFNWQPCYNNVNSTNADNWCCLQTFAEIYMLDPTAANANMISNARQCITRYFDNVKPSPPYVNPGGWWWCDALYMAPPAITRFCKAVNENRFLDSLNRFWWATSGYLYNSTEKFWYRDNGLRSQFWSGGNAWAIGGLVRVLDHMPGTYANRTRFETQFKEMCAAIKAQQGFTTPYDGMWTTSMLNHTGFPGPESIGTAFFCYAFAWGVRNKLLDSATYVPSINKAWRDLVKNVRQSDGRLLKCQHVDWGPTNMLTNGDSTNSAPEGEGAFLLAGSEMYLRATQTTTAAERKAVYSALMPELAVRGSRLTFTLASPARSSLKIYSTDGRCAVNLTGRLRSMAAGPNYLPLNAVRLAPGAYSAVLADGNGEITRLFVVR